MPSLRLALGLALGLALAAATLSACSNDPSTGSPAQAASPVATPTASPFESQFTRDGTYQSHQEIDGIDFVYTIYPTKATPRTNEWFALGDKYFSFTFQAYDLDRDLRDPFETKRQVFLNRIRVTSTTQSPSGTSESPYRLSGKAASLTFDPEPQKGRYGMLVTSPKGAFEIRNQKIGPLAPGTQGVTLTFEAVVNIQREPGAKGYDADVITETVPIAIFPGGKTTEVAQVPINSN